MGRVLGGGAQQNGAWVQEGTPPRQRPRSARREVAGQALRAEDRAAGGFREQGPLQAQAGPCAQPSPPLPISMCCVSEATLERHPVQRCLLELGSPWLLGEPHPGLPA